MTNYHGWYFHHPFLIRMQRRIFVNYTSPQCDNGAVGGWLPSTPVSCLSALDKEKQKYILCSKRNIYKPSKGHTEGSIISRELTPRPYLLLFELAFLHYERSIYFNFQINITNSTFHLTFEVAQKLNVVYCLYFSEEFWMWCLFHNIWKEKIILQRTKFKSLPQDDDAKDDVASEYWPLNLWSAPIYKWPVMTALTVG